MTLVPAPPQKPVQASELEVGQTYWTPSGMGGVWTLEYKGLKGEEGHHEFAYTNSNGPSGSLIISDGQVPKQIFVDHSRMSAEEYEAAGGKYR
jgi:hypothetical protein